MQRHPFRLSFVGVEVAAVASGLPGGSPRDNRRVVVDANGDLIERERRRRVAAQADHAN